MSLPLKLISLFHHQPVAVATITSRRFFQSSASSYHYCNNNNNNINNYDKESPNTTSRRRYCQHRHCNSSSHEIIIIRRQHFYREYSSSTYSTTSPISTTNQELPFFNDISQLPPSSSSILKQEDHELSMDEIKLKIALNEYLNEIKSTTTTTIINDNQKYLLDNLQQAYMDIEYWEEALQIEQYKCQAFYSNSNTNTDTDTDTDTSTMDEYADSIHVQGKLYLRQQDFINSKRLYDDSFTYFEKTNNTIQQGHVLISLAGWYFFQSNSSNDDDQQKHLNMAMDCLKRSELMLDSNPALLVKCLDNQGLIYRLWGEYNIALDKYQQALQVVVDKETRSALLMHIADMYVALELPNDALTVYQDILLEISNTNHQEQQQDDLGIRGVLLHNIATIHVDQGEHELALEEFREALRIKQIAGGEHNPEVAKTLNSLGALHAGVFNDKLQALDYFKQALLIARIHVDNDHDTDIMNALQNISLMEQDLYGERQS